MTKMYMKDNENVNLEDFIKVAEHGFDGCAGLNDFSDGGLTVIYNAYTEDGGDDVELDNSLINEIHDRMCELSVNEAIDNYIDAKDMIHIFKYEPELETEYSRYLMDENITNIFWLNELNSEEYDDSYDDGSDEDGLVREFLKIEYKNNSAGLAKLINDYLDYACAPIRENNHLIFGIYGE